MKTKIMLMIALGTLALQSCTHADDPIYTTPPTAYELADGIKGGIMYDTFWAVESGYPQTSLNLMTLATTPDFFRCKQCHAWDGLGTAGSYNNRKPNATRPNVSSVNLYQFVQTSTPQQLFDAMLKTTDRRNITTNLSTATQAVKDQMPNYTELLTEAQLWDMVKFLKADMYDVSKLYAATYTGTYPLGTSVYSNVGLDGNEANGNAYYTKNCAGCHGADGKEITDLDGTVGMTVGKFTRVKPNELQHKIHYGQLDTSMGSRVMTLTEMKDLYKAMANTTNFPD